MSVRVFPSSNSITFKPIVVVGRMIVAKKHFPVCGLLTFRRVGFSDR